MTFMKVGPVVINLDRIAWIETVEGRPIVHFAGGGEFKPRNDEEAKALHLAVASHLPPAEQAHLPAYGAWSRK